MPLLRTRQEGPVRILTLDDPDRRNILSGELGRALHEAVAVAESDAAVKALVVTGAGPAFCAGADLGDLKAAAAGDTALLEPVYASFLAVANCRLPTIAAVNGPAVGAGFNLALACDMRVAAEEARFDTRFLSIGLHPGGGHSWLLLRAVGWSRATRMLLLGEVLDAYGALAIGLIEWVCDQSELLGAAVALAGGLNDVPREEILATKATLRLAAGAGHAATVAHETEQQLRSLGRPPFRALVARFDTRDRPHSRGAR